MELPRRVDELQKLQHQLRQLHPLFHVGDALVGASRVLLRGQQAGFQNVVVHAHQPVDGVVVHLPLLAVLNGELQELDLLGAALDAPVQNDGLEPAEFRVFSGELPEAGKAPVSVDDPAVVQYHARLPLLHELDVGRGFADGVGIALHNEALDDLVVRLPVRRFRGLPAVLGPVLADPCGDAVVLVVVVELAVATKFTTSAVSTPADRA